jgi:hypothetical protein
MKRTHLPRLALLLLTATLTPLRADLPSEESLHAELRQWKATYEKAINTGDLSPLEPLFTPATTGVVVDNQSFKSFAELQAIYTKFHADLGPNLQYRVSLTAEPSQIFGDLAVAHGTNDETVTTGAGEFTYTSTWTAVLRRVDGHWILIRSQATMNPFHNSVVAYFLAKTRNYYGLGGALAGLVVGAVAALALRRRPA